MWRHVASRMRRAKGESGSDENTKTNGFFSANMVTPTMFVCHNWEDSICEEGSIQKYRVF